MIRAGMTVIDATGQRGYVVCTDQGFCLVRGPQWPTVKAVWLDARTLTAVA